MDRDGVFEIIFGKIRSSTCTVDGCVHFSIDHSVRLLCVCLSCCFQWIFFEFIRVDSFDLLSHTRWVNVTAWFFENPCLFHGCVFCVKGLICLLVYLFISSFVYLLICLFIRLFVYLFAYLFICLFVSVCVNLDVFRFSTIHFNLFSYSSFFLQRPRFRERRHVRACNDCDISLCSSNMGLVL